LHEQIGVQDFEKLCSLFCCYSTKMKPSIACTVLLASLLLACSHGVEQQVHCREHTASNTLFADPGDYGVEGRQGYPVGTLPPTPSSGPTAGGGYGNPETLPPTPSSGPTTGGGYGNPETLSPTPFAGPTGGYVTLPPTTLAPDSCKTCGDIIVPFDFRGFKIDIENIANDFISNFTTKVLSPSLCAPDNSPSCLQTLEDLGAMLDSFQEVVSMSLSEMDVIICEQDTVGPVTPECSLNGLNNSAVKLRSDGHRLE
jgi:hypothetical protein